MRIYYNFLTVSTWDFFPASVSFLAMSIRWESKNLLLKKETIMVEQWVISPSLFDVIIRMIWGNYSPPKTKKEKWWKNKYATLVMFLTPFSFNNEDMFMIVPAKIWAERYQPKWRTNLGDLSFCVITWHDYLSHDCINLQSGLEKFSHCRKAFANCK